MTEISIDENCLGSKCRQCEKVCVGNVFTLEGERTVVTSPETCTTCGHCVAICPRNAIIHESYPDELPAASEAIESERLIHDMASLRSIRRFKETRIPEDTLQALIKAASLAPTAHNRREMIIEVYQGEKLTRLVDQAIDAVESTTRLVERPFMGTISKLARKRDAYDTVKRFLPELHRTVSDWRNDGRDRIFFNAPVVMLFLNPEREFAEADAYLAIANIRLLARSLSIGTTMSGFFIRIADHNKEISESLGVPDGYGLRAALALGYPKHDFRKIPPRPMPAINWH